MGVIQAHEKIAWYSFIDNILQNGIRLIIIVILLAMGFMTSSIIISYVLSILVIFLAAFYVCKYKIKEVFGEFKISKPVKKRVIHDLFAYSWPLTFFTLISYFFYWIDSFIIGYFKTASDVGYYNAAVPIASFLIFAPALFAQLFFPLITKAFGKKNLGIIGELSKQVTKWVLILNLPLFAIMVFFPGAFLNILFGSEYIVAKNALIFLAIGSFFSSVFNVSSNLISIIGKSKLVLVNIIIVSIINLFLASLLVQKYGINGAAFATMISNIILTLILLFEIRYYTAIVPLRRKMIGVLFSGAVSIAALIYIKQFFPINALTITLQLLFFGLVYLLMIFLTKSLDKNDLAILGIAKNKLNLMRIRSFSFIDS